MIDKAAIIKRALAAGLNYIGAAIEKDAQNRYSLIEDWMLPPVRAALPEYEDDAFVFIPFGERTVIMVKSYRSTSENAICDGCSMSPDKLGQLNMVPASLFHDRWYGCLEHLVDVTGLTERAVRKLGDKVFASIILAENKGKRGAKTIATLYYWGVRLFGGVYHAADGNAAVKALATIDKIAKKTSKVIAIAVISMMLSGCSGCVSTIFDEDDGYLYDPPTYEQTNDTIG